MAVDNVEGGYSYSVCVRCFNDFATYEFDRWVIQQYKNPQVGAVQIMVDPTPRFITPFNDQAFQVSPGDTIKFAMPQIQAEQYPDIVVEGLKLKV
jgi:hypothetical protein